MVVVGGGHAGCEAALAAARLGCRTLMLTLNLDRIAWQVGVQQLAAQASATPDLTSSRVQPCNPAVGGPAKSQLVHEVDALGGEMGKMADRTYVQKRVLNMSKVRSVQDHKAAEGSTSAGFWTAGPGSVGAEGADGQAGVCTAHARRAGGHSQSGSQRGHGHRRGAGSQRRGALCC